MTLAPQSTLVGRTGVFYTGYICSLAGIIFREMPQPDVGIDGLIEVVNEEGVATGQLALIQIKSGDSFVNVETNNFTFRAEKKHFQYWNKAHLPVIGVVYSPSWEIVEGLYASACDVLTPCTPGLPLPPAPQADPRITGNSATYRISVNRFCRISHCSAER